MIQVTDDAIKWLQAIDFPVDRVLRLESTDAEHLVLTFGDPQAGDFVVEKDGEDLLHVPLALDAALMDAELDRVETANGPGLALFAYDWDPDEPTAERPTSCQIDTLRVTAIRPSVYRLKP